MPAKHISTKRALQNDSSAERSQQKPVGSVIINGEKYPLPAQVIENIKTVISLQADQERKVPMPERVLSKVAAAFGRSQFLYGQITFFTVWGLLSYLIEPALRHWDLPVMNLQNHGLDMAALLITTGVLVRQTQQDKIAERRSHLMLQINLLNEQKIAKVIELIEELRTDTPDVRNRYDWEASIMQQSTDPQVVLDILQENLEQGNLEKESAQDPLEREELAQKRAQQKPSEQENLNTAPFGAEGS